MKLASILAALLLTLSSAQAAGKISTITCNVKEKMDNKRIDVTVEFVVKNLGSKKAELMSHPKAGEYGAILVTPEEVNGMSVLMSHLNGQGGDLRVNEERIRLFGDGAGYTFVDLVLFKEAGYKKGYVRVSGSADQMYQTINCTVK